MMKPPSRSMMKMRLSEVIDDLYDRVLECQNAMKEEPTEDYEEEGFLEDDEEC